MKQPWYSLMPIGHGHYLFTTEKRGVLHKLTVTDMEIVDLIKSRERGWITAVKNLRVQAEPVYKSNHKSIKH